ncbi:hypothetical protein A2422_00585 [Candidatus Woesebacteria bacterium RIFOXYC1_FULL_31_51]|uniref:Glycerophosphoryl diester phosphodiesterase membrane domain-containing protein n=1 Tax=Candidatus Woesebacteria bacterium GW2011_GWC2_31_9 TaxID=1618586 RepID=A0A0F9YJL5_9BACT|nr:MAG: hypothetical protein UR17_C0001G0364 [Candidatus Woesebacteria bacterium GW2011_GWF1_31_35]KKP23145.1 MAG: hypothetical protein UR11_C0001G0119 [Candidatus Woesebacteria bacterium GW2011_GWC1_30_29]KKP26833.1 MAG: hypothetical protein UR13_C0002G0068 [Candidatus Woesebacteria bacterium GW2011_GWD1_31_12]KKP27408.1 MAG: hypothetical protein UR16_C0003G0068 [Candidatus Woesebacteria bacterium GW2011_GWB1_31_29]KKP31709.1 MAG: hypothetical protein UR21_C0006G0024 [Candidatus Woesebacteria 
MKKPIEYIKESWTIYTKRENFLFFSKVMAILVIVSTGLSYLINYLYPINVWKDFKFDNTPMLVGFTFLMLLSIVIGFWVKTVTYLAILTKPTDDIKTFFKKGLKSIWKFYLISLVIGILIFLGSLLLIIPGIIFAVWFSFSIFLILDKNLKIKDSLLKSKSLVKGKFLKIFGRFIVFGFVILIIQTILGLIPYMGTILVSFLAPLFILPFYLLYRDLLVSS